MPAKKKEKNPELMTMGEMTKELQKLKTELAVIKVSTIAHTTKVERSIRESKKCVENVRKLNMILGGTYVDKAKKDAAVIGYHYNVAFLKTIVMTEVLTAYSIRKQVNHSDIYKMTIVIAKAYDNNNEWWSARKDLSILQWINTFLKSKI